VRGQEPDRVVAPVVAQAAVDQELLGHELVHRHELDRRDADPLQVGDHGGVREAGVGAALVLRDLGMEQGQPSYVCLVDDRLVVRDLRRPVLPPVVERVDDHVLRHVRRAVRGVPLLRVAELVVEQRLIPPDVSLDRLTIRVEQQLGTIAAQPARGVVGSVHAVAVLLPRRDAGQVDVPDETIDLGYLDPFLGQRALVIILGRGEQAQLDAVGDLREQRKVRPPPVPGRAKRIRRSRPGTHSPPSPASQVAFGPAADSTGYAHARRDVRYRIVIYGSGILGFPKTKGSFTQFYAAARARDLTSMYRSSTTSATSGAAPSTGETAAAPAASDASRIRSANKPGASR